jgi:hypothetical protein
MVQGSRLVRPRTVTAHGDGLVSHAGLGWLAETAELAGLTAGLTAAMAAVPQRRHDPGRTLAQVVLALADGATCLSDLAALRAQPGMFGAVGSETTVWRTFDAVGPVELRGIAAARAAARERAWAAGAGPAGDLIIDLDATIIRTRADKQDAAPTYKRTYGHHPLLAMCADTDEVLAGMIRPGNAGANTAIDHVVVLADAIAQLPPAWQAGHRPGNDDPEQVVHKLLVRADSAGASHWLADECVDRNCEFSFGYQIDERVRGGVILVPTGCWHPAVNSDGSRRDGAEVVELTEFVNLDAWPAGTRLIVRRERPLPTRRSQVQILPPPLKNPW